MLRLWRRRASVHCVLLGAILIIFGAGAIFMAFYGDFYATDAEPMKYRFQREMDSDGQPAKFVIPNHGANAMDPGASLAPAPVVDLAPDLPLPDYRVHIFYYPWYGNPKFDSGKYYHWNHPRLAHWNRGEAKKWPLTSHIPPEDIGASFYPELASYSSHDPEVLHKHLKWIRQSGAGVIVTSYYPRGMSDPQGRPWHKANRMLMDFAAQYRLKVTFHIEPYENRNPANLKENIEELFNEFEGHPAFYKHWKNGADFAKPMYYIYDSYRIEPEAWHEMLKPGNLNSIRNSRADGYFLALLLNDKDKIGILSAGFDGFYTYFAATGFSDGSTPSAWPSYRVFAKKNKLIFCPSVGPGYDDLQIRPWNGKTTRRRENGTYFETMFRAAIKSRPDIISITSFNEWHEGTQIEPAIPMKNSQFTYFDYSPNNEDFYLKLTRKFVTDFVKVRKEPFVD